MRIHLAFVSGVVLLTSLSAAAGDPPAPRQVLDVNPFHEGDGSHANLYTFIGTTTFFVADHPVYGREVWKTDGTEAGTKLVADVAPGGGSSTPNDFVAANGLLFFTAEAVPDGDRTLFRSDGTAAGTWEIALAGGVRSIDASLLTPYDGRLAFAAYDPTHGEELYLTDGSATPATRIEFRTGTGGGIDDLEVVGANLFVSGASDTSGVELHRYNDTDGRVLVRDIVVGSSSSSPRKLTAAGTKLVFTARKTAGGSHVLWESDGTQAGTLEIPTAANPSTFVYDSATATLYFTTGSWPQNRLWMREGASALVELVPTAPLTACCDLLTASPVGLFLTASDAASGSELYRIEGTSVVRVADIRPGVRDSEPLWLTWFKDALYFMADDGVHGIELWRSDGTAAGTQLAYDVDPGGRSSVPSVLTATASQLWFSAREYSTGEEPWITDGTAAGTRRIADVNPSTLADGSKPRSFLTHAGVTYFVASHAEYGSELWRTDGTAEGTRLVKDLAPGAYDSHAAELVVFRDRIFFAADDGTTGKELWSTDGTTEGTIRHTDLPGAELSFEPMRLAVLGDSLYFVSRQGTIVRVFRLPPGSLTAEQVSPAGESWLEVVDLVVSGARLFATVETDIGVTLWSTDGSTALAALPGGVVFDDVSRFVNPVALSGERMVFVGNRAGSDYEPWVASVSGVTELPVRIGTSGSFPNDLFSAGPQVFFSADDGTNGEELYVYASGSAPTRLDLAPGSADANPTGFTVLDGAVYFAARDLDSGVELWRTNGTVEGTVQVAELASGPGSSAPDGLVALDARLYFWATGDDGTRDLHVLEPASDRLVKRAELADVSPNGPVTAGASAFLFAAESGTDVELWAVSRNLTPPEITPVLAGPEGKNGWFIGDVAVSFTVADAEFDGLLEVLDCAPATLTTDSAGATFTCRARSDGGEREVSVLVQRDTVAPSLQCTPTAFARSADAQGVPVTLEVLASDATDPATPTSSITRSDGASADAPYPLGTTSVQVVAEDAAGNASAPCAVSVEIAPALSHYGFSCASSGGDGVLSWFAVFAVLVTVTRWRRMTKTASVVAAIVTFGFASAPASAAENGAPATKKPAKDTRLKLALTGVAKGPGATADATRTLEDSLESELAAVGLYQVISPNLVSTLLGAERQRQLLGCDDSEATAACMAEIAGALDGDRIVNADLARVGDSWVFNVSLVEARKGKLLHRVGHRVDGASLEPLLDELRPLVYQLVNVEPALAGKPLRTPRRFGGLVIGLRGEADLLGPGFSAAPSLMLEYSGRRFGGALTVIAQTRPGARLEGRFYPVTLGNLRPYLAAGGTAFPSGIAARGALGASFKIDRLQLFADVAYERFVVPLARDEVFAPHALVLALGAGWGI